ncbi:MAG: alpha/beta hydrolase [Armatimonadota bacterium]|jgi:dipeptidyl aminopeptidase/acylaminoacyl peptidase
MEQFREFEVGGERIAASIHIPTRTPAPGLVMCHGFTGQRMEAHFLFVKAARALCEAGVGVLRFDFRGSGESGGSFREMTISREIEDARAALEVMRAEPSVDPQRVGLLGLSLGGLVAACAVARDSQVRALVLWSAVAEMGELIRQRWEMPTEPGVEGGREYYERGAHEIGAAFLRDALRVDPLAEIARYSGPVLVVHGDADEAVPVEHAHRYMDAIRADDAQLLLVEGADHTYSTVALESHVIAATRTFLLERL